MELVLTEMKMADASHYEKGNMVLYAGSWSVREATFQAIDEHVFCIHLAQSAVDWALSQRMVADVVLDELPVFIVAAEQPFSKPELDAWPEAAKQATLDLRAAACARLGKTPACPCFSRLRS